MATAGNCPQCRFFEPRSERDATGYCHRMPPTLLMDTDSTQKRRLTTRYPYVGKADYCGEFKK
jgi:hypothetical protein